MNGLALLLIVLTLASGSAALWLLLRIHAQEQAGEQQMRLRVLGADAGAAGYLSRRSGRRQGPVRALTDLLARSGLEFNDSQVGWGLMGLLLVLLMLWLALGALAGSLVALVAGVSVYGLLSRRAALRRGLIIEQMPSYLEAVMRVMAAGNTLEESLASAAREAPAPIGPLFLGVARQVRLGAGVDVVLADTADSQQLRDLKVVALAAAINQKYGGSLRQVLKSLITAIRGRASAARELKALTAETRFSALVLALIPLALSLYIFGRNRGYYTQMWDDSAGRSLLIASACLQLIGIVLIWRMMTRTTGPDA